MEPESSSSRSLKPSITSQVHTPGLTGKASMTASCWTSATAVDKLGMSEPRQINLLRVCNPAERRSLEDSGLAFSSQKQDLQFKAARAKRGTLQQGVNDDDSDYEQRPWQSRHMNRSLDDFSINQAYKYEPLPFSTSIRLLEIQRESPNENVLHCRMKITSIARPPVYDALSYTWGIAKETEDLECDGKSVKVRRNLMNALRGLRHINNVRLIWADGICINQQNKKEKEKQISLMKEIYQMAKRVIVWIGEDSQGEAKPALDIIKRLSRNETKMLHALSHERSRHLLVSFYSQRWFSRAWIIQEVAMARTVEVIWGAEKISWEDVCNATAVIRTFDYQMPRHTPITEVYNAYMLHQLSAKKGLHLLYWLQASRTFHCTDPRDRVYSLLGLMKSFGIDDVPVTIRPNYRKKTRSLYKQVAIIYMKQIRTLDVLTAGQHDTMKSYRPTWVPRWNFSHTLSIAQLDPELQGFTACGTLPRPRVEWSGKYNQILHVNGIEFDQVSEISDIISDADNSSDQTMRLVRILAKVLTTRHSYPNSDDIHHVCCWTVTAGKDHYSMLVTDTQRHLADFNRFWSRRKHITAQAQDVQFDRFIHAALNSCRGRRLFYTAKGYIGLGSAALWPGDVICVLCGGTVPMALRETIHNRYLLIGEVYVHGIMHGEAVNKKSVVESFEIV